MTRRRVRAGVASGLALASGLGISGLARARTWELRGDAGLFAAFHFGGRRGGEIALGFEAHGVYVDGDHDCGGTQQLFSGLVGRMEVVDWAQMRLTVGPVLGRSNGLFGVAGEVTGGMALGRDRGVLVHLGAEASGLFLLDARLGYAVTRDWQAALGLRFPPISYSGLCVVGRPLRRDGRASVQGAGGVRATGTDASSDLDRSRAASIWMRRACLEWASVPAFAELAEQLRICGAPLELVARARAAAIEELEHAVASASVAGTLGDLTCVSLDPPVTDRRSAATGAAGLARLAVESWLDGCVGEGVAAAIAGAERDAATDGAVKQTQSRIAIEESRHAELAWDVLEWALAADPARVWPLLMQAGSAASTNASGVGPTAAEGLPGFGILDPSSIRALHDEVAAGAHARLAARLAA